jgi:nicotinate-nucleotide adenylyltransferase
MVVTPHNPHKKKSTLLDDYHRLEMVHLATADFPNIQPSDIEFKLPQPNYTVNTLAHLLEKFPQHEFSLIMGEDNLNSLHKWKNYDVILQNHAIYVYPRLNSGENEHTVNSKDTEINSVLNHKKIHKIDAPIVELSSTFIRESIKNGKNITPMLPKEVWEYIEHNLFYKK